MLINGDKCLENVRILDVGNKFGNMNTSANFYPKEMTLEERQISLLKKRRDIASVNDFDYRKFFVADQTCKDGSYCVLTPELIADCEDGWLKDIPEDILIITKDTPGVVIGHPVADCPVIVMTDKEHDVTALGHCSGEMVDMRLPMHIFFALQKEFGTTPENVKVYVSSCISDKWEYDRWPGFAKNKELWVDAITEVNSLEKGTYYNIDIRKAVHSQLLSIGINDTNIYWNMDDTLTNSNYYSNSAARFDDNKKGRNFVGAYYPFSETDSEKIGKLK